MRIVFDITDKFARTIEKWCDNNSQLTDIKRSLRQIMANQEEFNAQIARANTALDEVATAIAAEGQQIRDFIAANPSVDTSALEGVVARLESVNESVAGVFEPATEEEPTEPEA